MDLNKVTLIGNMVRDPESRVAGNQTLTRFSLATNYAWQDVETKAKKESVDFHDVVAWGKLGEIIQQYVKKGSKLYVEGRLHKRVYTTHDGQRRSSTEIVANNMIMLGHRPAQTKQEVSTANAKLIREDVDIEEVDE